MNAEHRARRLGIALAASVLVAVMAASAVGCSFLEPKTKKAFAETCAVDSDCESLDCAGQGNMCSRACQYNADCGGTLVCRQKDDGSGDHCTQPGGVKLNGSCMDFGDCENGHCLKHMDEDNAPGICSRFCTAPADCPDGMKVCETISDTGVLKMCLPGGAPGVPVAKFGTVPRRAVAKPVVTVPPPVVTVPPVVTAPPVAAGAPGQGLVARTAAPTATAVPPPAATTVAKPTPTAVKLKPRH